MFRDWASTYYLKLEELGIRNIWWKADPKPTPLVKAAMEKLGIPEIKDYAEKKRLDPVRLETALLRYGKDFLRRGRELKIDLSYA